MKKAAMLMFFLLIPISLACTSDRECPLPDCLGATRSCEQGQCTQSSCIAFLDREWTQEDGILISLESESEQDLFQSLFSYWPAMVTAILFFILAFKIYGYFGPSPSFVFSCLILLIVVGGGYQVIIGIFGAKDASRLWDKYTPEDFHQSARDDLPFKLSGKELSFAAPGAKEGVRWFIEEQREEYSVAILKFQNKSAIPYWKIPQLGFSRQNLYGELIYKAQAGKNTIFLFDEDRFVFIVAGQEDIALREIQQIVQRYPYRTDKWRSRLSLKGVSPPAFYNIEPPDGSSTKEDLLSFFVSDDISLRPETIQVIGVPGFSLSACAETLDGHKCSFPAAFSPGENTLLLQAKDNADLIGSKQITIYKDVQAPDILDIFPQEGSIINETAIRFTLLDDFALDITTVAIFGIQGFHYGTTDCSINKKTTALCAFLSSPKEGLNNFRIYVEDIAGNIAEKTVSFTYVNSPRIQLLTPKDRSFTNSPILSFIVGDESGIEHKSIIISTSDSYEEIFSSCIPFGQGFEIKYRCQKDFPKKEGSYTVTITATDMEDRISKMVTTFTVDLRPPQFLDVVQTQYKGETFLNFTVMDSGAGLDTESLEFSGVDSLDLSIDCSKPEKGFKATNLSCALRFGDLPKGEHALTLFINDKAANQGEHIVGLRS